MLRCTAFSPLLLLFFFFFWGGGPRRNKCLLLQSNSHWDEKFHLVQRSTNKNYSKDSVLLRCEAASQGNGIQTFRRNALHLQGYDLLILEDGELRCVTLSESDHPLIQRKLSEQRNPQLHRCEHLLTRQGFTWHSTSLGKGWVPGPTHKNLSQQDENVGWLIFYPFTFHNPMSE
jgi:hypothetical protein